MDETQTPTDIFLWANNTDAVKQKLTVELFLFNKNYTVFSVDVAEDLNSQLKPLFLFDYMNVVTLGAGTGMTVGDYELSEAGEGVLLRTELDKVGKAATVLHQIEKERGSVQPFSDDEHDFKRIKGVIAKFTDETGKTFYSAKAIQQSNVVKGSTAWQLRGPKFSAVPADVTLKFPADNQVLIIDSDIFIFNQRKFETLFQYDFKKQLIADKKLAEIAEHYKLSFPDGLDLQSLIQDRKSLANKLQKIEIGEVPQEKVIEYADDMQLELMSDDTNAIIIMDGNDLGMFVNLINEDYITSEITGKRYEIKAKKLLGEPDGEPPRG